MMPKQQFKIILIMSLMVSMGCSESPNTTEQVSDAAVRSDVINSDGGTPSDAMAMPCEIGDATPADVCPDGLTCSDGRCVQQICEPATSRCVDAETLEVCRQDGLAWETTACEMGECREMRGAATCDDVICVAGERTCNGPQTIVECTADGTQFTIVERCDGDRTGRQCDQGECVPLCRINEKVKTNIGCDYWAADLDNALVPGGDGFLNAERAPYAVVVSNPHPSFTAQVTVTNNEETVADTLVPPLGLHVFNLPHRDINQTSITPLAYRIRSSIPIVAYQFNPLENEEVFSNDASLLLPSHVLGQRYFVMTREQSFAQLRGFLTVVAINAEPTTVNVTVTARTQGGVGGIPAMEPGDQFEAVLNQYDVLNIKTGGPGADLTGSLIESSQPVVVFAGSEAANVPNTNHCVDIDPVDNMGVCESDRDVPCRDNYDCNRAGLNTCCADHLEQQLFPVKTWGRRYLATKSYDRGNERDYWRIIAAEDDTKIETVPPQTVVPTLNAGEWFEFGSREHFEIISDKPVMVGQFLASEHAPNPNRRNRLEPGDAATGDPAFILAVPVEQFRPDFVFLAPDKYQFDYVSVTAPVDSNVFFDDIPIMDGWEPVGDGSEWRVARFQIGDGVHFLDADQPISVIVYGYDQYVSYGYPGGLNLDVVDSETGEAR
ncbi:MAG: IgGFc-binding protein [Myxococcota bacterium]|nr:IgGFc-binding protein [Myxococcota bacterium]